MIVILVSIVTPTLNSEKYIEDTIQSVMNQTYCDIEHIIIDGCSQDGTLDIIGKYPHLVVFVEKDDSMYQAINKGLRIAKGEILAYLNSDDIYYENTIEQVVDFFKSYKDVKMLYSNINFIDSNGLLLYSFRYPDYNWYKYVAYTTSYIPQPTTFWKKEVHARVGYFDDRFKLFGDKDFFIRVGQEYKIKKTKKILAAMRLHQDALTYIVNKKKNSDLVSISIQENRMISSAYKGNRSRIHWLYYHLHTWILIKLLNIKTYYGKALLGIKRTISH